MEIIKTRQSRPPRILIHAAHGLGKSSLAAAAPNPLFIQTEDGLENIDASAFSLCQDFETMMEQLGQVYTEDHDYKTLVIDSLDWTETLVYKHVCREAGNKSLSEFDYGAGYIKALEQFNRVVRALTDIRDKLGMIIILTAHSQVKTYHNPMGSDYDRHQIKLRDKNAELFLEWCDLVSFLHFQTFTKKKTKKESGGFAGDKAKGIGGSERVLSCVPSAAYVSKNRYGITSDISIPTPDEGWENIVKAVKGEA